MALHLVACGFFSTLLIHFSLVHSRNGQVSSSNSSVKQVNYVTPNSIVPCLKDQQPCFTIEEYAGQVDTFFINNSIFSFDPGNHSLNIGLNIRGIHNVSFIGLPNSSSIVTVLNKSTYIMWKDCGNIEITNINFVVESDFSCILFFESTLLVKLTNVTVLGNSHTGCSSIISNRSTVNISNSKFNGITGFSGAALFALHSNITFTGTNSFFRNMAESGGSIYFYHSSVIYSGISTFTGNTAKRYNRTDDTLCQKLTINNNYINNSVEYSGGAIFCDNSNFASVAQSVKLENNDSTSEMPTSDVVKYSMSDIDAYTINYSSIQFFGNVILFFNNSAKSSRGALSLASTNMTLCGSILFINNHANSGGSISTRKSNIFFGINCSSICSTFELLFQHNIAEDKGGSIMSFDSHVWLRGYLLFTDNTAKYGGAIFLDGTSNLIFKPTMNLTFGKNRATNKGGVIYYDSSVASCVHFQQLNVKCFVSFSGISLENISLTFLNNSADSKIGQILYSGKLEVCYRYLYGHLSNRCRGRFQHIECKISYPAFLSVSTFFPETSTTLLSADAEQIEFCSPNSPREWNVSIYPGAMFNVPLFAIGPVINITVHTKIFSKLVYPSDLNIHLIEESLSTEMNNSCTNVSYYILASNISYPVTAHYQLYHDNPCDSLIEGVFLNVTVKPCPRDYGFQLSDRDKKCKCDDWLQSFTNNCDINSLFIERKKNNFWVSKSANGGTSVLILHEDPCPFHFCKDQSVNVSLDNPNVQCDFNRNGTLCGQCREQYSLALGTLHCRRCVNSSYIALAVLFFFAGIVLVIGLLLLHWTVDVGTLNGLIFYANIVHSNRVAYFQHTREITNFHTIFISWLNLDFGIETCFYDGMDVYAYSWLQFSFPIYLWFLIGAIIVICHYSQRLSNILGRNTVATLGTVLFLSYCKLLNAIIAPLSKTELTFTSTDGTFSTRSVWLYDGSVEYFAEPKHIVLGLFAILILLVSFVPYTFILLCGHRLIAYSDKCFLSWLNKIKPFLDVYYAPFKQEARYWIGLTLFVRLTLRLIISVDVDSSHSAKLLVITSVTACLLLIKGRVYEHRHNDILEFSFILNLCVLSIATFYLKVKDIKYIGQAVISNASVGISFVTFIGILLFHICLLLKSKSVFNYFFQFPTS